MVSSGIRYISMLRPNGAVARPESSNRLIGVMDWTTLASALFFFVALVNPRDYPIENVPLIYPAFLLFWSQIGTAAMFAGLRRVRYLCVLLGVFQIYLFVRRVTLGETLLTGDYAFLIEPLMILLAAGAATVRPEGVKSSVWILVGAVTVSAVFGIGIYLIGEPFTTIRSTLQSSVGGSIVSESILREMDLEQDLTDLLSLNAGLTKDVFTFAYQISVALVIVLAAMLSRPLSFSRSYLLILLACGVLLLALFTNTERATIAAVLVGGTVFVWTGRNVPSLRVILFVIVCTAVTLGFALVSSLWANDKASLLHRNYVDDATGVRLYMVIPAVTSVIYQPLGAGGHSEHYNEVAFQVGWLRLNNGVLESHSPHNHFAGVIMLAGVFGAFGTVLLLGGLWTRIRLLRRYRFPIETRMLAAACVASVIHSCFHNAGFFGLVPPTLLSFGLFWGAMPPAVRR